VPQYYNEVPLIVKQAKAAGFNKPFLGSDSWGSGDLMGLCGDDCKGYYFVTHYAAAGAKGKTKEFIEEYNKLYNKLPDDVAALTWDSVNVVVAALKAMPAITGDLAKDREALTKAMVATKDFPGITGTLSFPPTGDHNPIKCAVVVKIDENGKFGFFKSVCP
jgi:branched-chain amino acid transport system substrate-binding protein